MKRKQTLKALIAAALAAVMLTGCADKAETPNVSTPADSPSISSTTDVSSVSSASSVSGGESSSGTSSTASSSDTVSTALESSTPESSSAPESSAPVSSIPESAPESTSSSDISGGSTPVPSGGTPFERHGGLSVKGTDLVDANGAKFQLRGMSTHGLAWFPQFVNYNTFKYLRDDWNTNCIRLAMYTYENGGYCTDGNKEQLKALVSSGVDYATQLGMYVIIDWHVLNDRDPNTYKSEAIKFFDDMSRNTQIVRNLRSQCVRCNHAVSQPRHQNRDIFFINFYQ